MFSGRSDPTFYLILSYGLAAVALLFSCLQLHAARSSLEKQLAGHKDGSGDNHDS